MKSLLLPFLLSPKNILEIGSRQTKNQHRLANLRPLFPESRFLGTAIQPGPGVDQVVNAENLPFSNGSFDLALCLETLEHALKPWKIAQEIERVMAAKGIAIVSSQQNSPLHFHSVDYFRFTPYGLASLFPQCQSTLKLATSPPFDDESRNNPRMVIFIGSKSKQPLLFTKVKSALIRHQDQISAHKPYRHRLQDGLQFIKRGLNEAVFLH